MKYVVNDHLGPFGPNDFSDSIGEAIFEWSRYRESDSTLPDRLRVSVVGNNGEVLPDIELDRSEIKEYLELF